MKSKFFPKLKFFRKLKKLKDFLKKFLEIFGMRRRKEHLKISKNKFLIFLKTYN